MADEESIPSGPYFERLPLWPDFALSDNSVDGRIPACRVESWEKFQSNLNGEKDDPTGAEKVYRGQRRFDWPLESTLTRRFDGGSIPDDMAHQMLHKFKLAMRGRGIDLNNLDNDNEIWAYGQHYGLATPMVDWTDSPFVALFFAYAKEDVDAEKDNPSRAVFCLNRAEIEKLMPNLFFEPALGENARLVNQAGLFTVTPAGDNNLETAIVNAVIDSGAIDADDANALARYICKIHIPNNGRDACLTMLRKMNIHHANLFPDPAGASDYCNDWIERCVKDQAEKRKAKDAEKKARRTVSLSELARMDADNFEAVATLLNALLPEGHPEIDGSLAMKIDSKYQETASLDWPRHASGVAQVRVAFKRLLSLFSYPEESLEQAVEQLVEFYKSKYEARG
jgi:hypothetical protein